MIKIERPRHPANEWKRYVRTLALAACLGVLFSTSIPLVGGHSFVASGVIAGTAYSAPLANLPATAGSTSLGTNSPFYSALYNTYVFWSATIYADTVSYYITHISFTSASLVSASNPHWSFGVGVSGDNLTISMIASNYIELDASHSPTSQVDIYFYYVGATPLSVTIGNTSISASKFVTSSSCTAPCVLLNQGSSYIEILNAQSSPAKNFVYPGAQPTTATTTTSSPPPPSTTTTTTSSPPPPPPSTTTTVATTSSTAQSSTTVLSSTAPPPPPPVTTTNVQATTTTTTTSSATSTNSSSTSTTTTSSQTSSSTSAATSSTTTSSSQPTSALTTSETSSTTSSSTKKPSFSPIGGLVAAIDSIQIPKSQTSVYAISTFASITVLVTIAPLAMRKVPDFEVKVKRLVKRVRRYLPRSLR